MRDNTSGMNQRVTGSKRTGFKLALFFLNLNHNNQSYALQVFW